MEQYLDDVERYGIYGQKGVVPPGDAYVHFELGDSAPADTRTLKQKLIGSPEFWVLMIISDTKWR